MDKETSVPVDLKPTRLGLREATLLILAASYAALMFDLPEVAIVGGWTAVALIVFAAIRGPRPPAALTFVYGLGIFLMTFWWPEEHWWQLAIPLMWVGIGIMIVGLLLLIRKRRGSDSGTGS
jgi:apolipoprotein N-acyltransferase